MRNLGILSNNSSHAASLTGADDGINRANVSVDRWTGGMEQLKLLQLSAPF
jgi:hypothetical protein